MRRAALRCWLPILSLVAFAGQVFAQSEAPRNEADSLPTLPNSRPGAEVATVPSAPPEFAVEPKFDYTYLPGTGSQAFTINDFETSTKFTIPLGDLAPLWLTPGGAVRLWGGPQSGPPGVGPDLPPQVYDLYFDIGWRPRPKEWLFFDMVVTPGLYSDFHNFDSSAFRPRGRGSAIIALSERFQFVLGTMYTNRLQTKILPIGGILWKPDDDTKYTLLFPAPKIARRISTNDDVSWWAYISGEFGGGTWAIQRDNGTNDAVDYSDIRVILGLEQITESGRNFHVEAGYVFSRRISYKSDNPPGNFDPDPTLMLRAGFSF
jgi:hypothetical protein